MIYTFAMIILRDLSRTKSCDLDVTPSVVYKHRPTLLNFAETFAYQFLLAIVIYVVVPFYPWFKFYFPLFLGMVMYDKEFETKGYKIWTKDKIEPQHVQAIAYAYCSKIPIFVKSESDPAKIATFVAR